MTIFLDKIFSWNKPPANGFHPGMEIGCRCWAEPILDFVDKAVESYYGYLLSLLTPPWDWPHFTVYFYIGFGRRVTLRRIGHLEAVINVSKGLRHLYDRVGDYYKGKAENALLGIFVDTSSNSYDFSDPLSIVEALDALPGIDKEKIPQIIKELANFKGTAYPIEDQWVEEVSWQL